ncbi:hypothetical protein ACLOJK_037184 [Asimina triloba]
MASLGGAAARDGWTLEVDRADGRHAAAGRHGVRLLGVSPSTGCRGRMIVVLLRGVNGRTDLLSGDAWKGGCRRGQRDGFQPISIGHDGLLSVAE